MNSDKARQRAEKSFKKEERAQDGRKAMLEYEISGPSHSRKDRTSEGAPISQTSCYSSLNFYSMRPATYLRARSAPTAHAKLSIPGDARESTTTNS